MVLSAGIGMAIIIVCGVVGILFAAIQMYLVASIDVSFRKNNRTPIATPVDNDTGLDRPLIKDEGKTQDAGEQRASRVEMAKERMMEINAIIVTGAKSFLHAEYLFCAAFVVVFGLLVFVLTAHKNKDDTTDGKSWDWKYGGLTALSFVIGAVTSMISGYIGMMVAVYSNVRTTRAAMVQGEAGWIGAFNTAFRAGGVMGFSLCGVAVLVLYLTIQICRAAYSDVNNDASMPGHHGQGTKDWQDKLAAYKNLFECVAGFGLGGSTIAMFGRVGGGIYTKAADVGADLAGKVVHGLPEDDPRNPACIADNVGDNVGDVAGMGSDLFGSFGEATCAALVIASQCPEFIEEGMTSVLFPVYISAVGIVVCLVTSFFATNIMPVKKEEDVEMALKLQLLISSILMTAVLYPLCLGFLPETASFSCQQSGSCLLVVSSIRAKSFLCVCLGLWGGCIIGFITEYYTSHSYAPVREVAQSTKTGAATNIIYGLALGYKSAILPATIIAVIVFISFKYVGMFGISLAALGMLSTLATCLSIDVFGPVCDNAGGIAEMSHCEKEVRQKTDSLDAAGNTTAAIGKGFAIGSAALVSLALFGAFTTRVHWLELYGVNVLRPITFAFLIIGAMLPYWFTAMTMKSVGQAAKAMVEEVQRQFTEDPDLLNKDCGRDPDYDTCIAISTNASLREMILPGLLVLVSPIFTGIFFGVEAVCGLLSGALVSGVQMAISQSNTGGAWDNAKKYIGSGQLILQQPKADGTGGTEDFKVLKAYSADPVTELGRVQQTLPAGRNYGDCTEEYAAAVCGDTVGDPLKDTSGPALNILMKLMAIISLVFSGFFLSINSGKGVFNIDAWDEYFNEKILPTLNITHS